MIGSTSLLRKQISSARRHRDALGVRLGERPVRRVADDLEREGQVERLGKLGRSVGRAVVDDDDLDVAVGRGGDGSQAAREVVAAIAVEDHDRYQRAARDGRGREALPEGRDEGRLVRGRRPEVTLTQTVDHPPADPPHATTDARADAPGKTRQPGRPRGQGQGVPDRPSPLESAELPSDPIQLGRVRSVGGCGPVVPGLKECELGLESLDHLARARRPLRSRPGSEAGDRPSIRGRCAAALRQRAS